MKKLPVYFLIAMVTSLLALAQKDEHHGGTRAGSGHIPAHGPIKAALRSPAARPAAERPQFRDQPGRSPYSTTRPATTGSGTATRS